MTNLSVSSLYFCTDKNIFDALMQKKITVRKLSQFLLKKGILVSEKNTKEELAKYIATLPFDYFDYSEIARLLESPNKKEKSTSSTIVSDSKILESDLKKVSHNIKEQFEKENPDTTINIKPNPHSNEAIILVNYAERDFSKTELKQKSQKKIEIKLKVEQSGELTVQYPANSKAKELVSSLQQNLSNIKDEECEKKDISLETILSPELRTFFFTELIKSIQKYQLENVLRVISNQDIRSDNLDDDDITISDRIGNHINKVLLDGQNILSTSECKQFHENGFFISKIVWNAINNDINSKVEFEAEFGDPETCTDFKYKVRGIFKYQEKTNDYSSNLSGINQLDNMKYIKLIEKAAENALKETLKKYEEQS